MSKSTRTKTSTTTQEPGKSSPQASNDGAPNVSHAYFKGVLDEVRLDVLAMKEEILSKLRNTVATLNVTVATQGQQIQDLEEGLTTVDSKVSDLEKNYTDLMAETGKLRARLDDLENRSHRQNITVIGLPEKIEGPQPSVFMETLLVEVFGADKFPKPPEVDQAHRSLRPLDLTKPPRAMIVRLHHFRTKELILRLAWQHSGQLSYGHKISFYPDLSADLLQRCAAFMPVKKLLREPHLSYSLVHPATLRFTFNGVEQKFKSPLEANAFVQGHIASRRASTPVIFEPTEITEQGSETS